MPKVRINYGVNRKAKGGKIEHKNGRITLDIPDGVDPFAACGDKLEIVRDAIRERNPGWSITGYAEAPKKGIEHEVCTKDGGTKIITEYTRKKAILAMCTACMGYESDPIKECTSPMCPLFPFRGKTIAAYHSDKEDI